MPELVCTPVGRWEETDRLSVAPALPPDSFVFATTFPFSKEKKSNMLFRIVLCLVTVAPVALLALSTGPPAQRTGAPVDGGLDCTACHRTFAPANSDPRGSVEIQTGDYRPGVSQTIRIIVNHPESSRWGFQVTARYVSNESVMAGTFVPTPSIRVVCANNQPAPCNGEREFATHTQPITTSGQNGRAIFEIEWIPPSDDFGEVVIYAAGNAADASLGNTGDRIYTNSLRIRNGGNCGLGNRPVITRAINSASGALGVTFNSLFQVVGNNFYIPGRTREAGIGDLENGRVPTQLGCVAVEVDGRRVPIIAVTNDRVFAQAPTVLLDGPVTVRVIHNPDRPNELRSDVATVPMSVYGPALFAREGVLVAWHADNTPVTAAAPASPGETIHLTGTGFGITEPTWQAGEIPNGPAPTKERVTVRVNGSALAAEDVVYAGLTEGEISGRYRISFKVPQSASGDITVTAEVAGRSTQEGLRLPVRR